MAAVSVTSESARSAAVGTAGTPSRLAIWISTSAFMPGFSSPPRLAILMSTANIVTFCSTIACGSIFEHLALERLVRIRGHGHAREHAGLDLADVGFVDARAHLHGRQVRHLHEHRAAADGVRRRRDHDAGLDRLLDDRARDRRSHVGVVERDARVLDGHVGADDLRLGIGELELRLLVVGLRQRLRLEQRSRSFHLRLRDLAPGLRRDERGLGLGQPIARRALVDLDEQAAGFDDVAGLGMDGQHFARRFRLHFDGRLGLDDARGVDGHLNAARLDLGRLVNGRGSHFGRLFAGGQHRDRNQQKKTTHTQ